MPQTIKQPFTPLARRLQYFDEHCRRHVWNGIWGAPRADAPEDDPIALSGAKHSRAGNQFDAAGYERIVDQIARLIGPAPAWLYEVGAGAGAMLAQLAQRLGPIPMSGCDASEYLCRLAPAELAIRPVPAHRVAFARAIPFDSQAAGVILSVGVFLYFPDLMYADFVISSLREAYPAATLVLCEIPDLAHKPEAEKLRGPTNHLYFPRDFFRIYDPNPLFVDYQFAGSVNSGFRCHVVLKSKNFTEDNEENER